MYCNLIDVSILVKHILPCSVHSNWEQNNRLPRYQEVRLLFVIPTTCGAFLQLNSIFIDQK